MTALDPRPWLLAAWILFAGTALGVDAAPEPRGEERRVASTTTDAVPTTEDVLALTPEIRRYLDSRIGFNMNRETRFLNLQSALFGKHGLEITYGNLETRTVAETFQQRSGNCLSFTLLFTAMARYLGLPAYFLEVDEVLSWDLRGEVVLNNRHMFSEVELYNGIRRVDFLPGEAKSYRRIRRVDDSRALAHYYNNRGAEILADGDLETAQVYFAKALELDSNFAAAWVNRGVALRKSGDLRGAEDSYRQALVHEPDEPTASLNLAALFLAEGRPKAAEPHLEDAAGHRRRNPFQHFRSGVRAHGQGDLTAATEHLRKALQLMPGEALFHATLGEVYASQGRRSKARQSLEQALRLSEDFEQLERIREQLRALDQGL
jgi:Tfp pilus assembly protein PilF